MLDKVSLLLALVFALNFVAPLRIEAGATHIGLSGRDHSSVRKSKKFRRCLSRERRRYHSRRSSRKKTFVSHKQIGILLQSPDGETLIEQAANVPFNPASAVKLLTAYGALKTFGPQHRFVTTLSL
ncbi:MAG TPA: D-alanyl-D-alanine carboxypeptidase, partial [Candidatus Obscuribacterales bacterium]